MEQKLSEKRVLNNGKCPSCKNENCYREEDVKEFIRLLKEELLDISKNTTTLRGFTAQNVRAIKIIDKLSGEKLHD